VKTFGKEPSKDSFGSKHAKWPERYFDNQGRIKVAQIKFWLPALG